MEINVKEIFAKYNIPTDRKEFKVNYTNLINCINEINKEVLKEAANNAELRDKEIPYEGVRAGGSYFIKIINKKSITSTINKVKF